MSAEHDYASHRFLAQPEVSARTAKPEEIPRNAAKLADLALDHGWAVRLTFARGWTLDTPRSPSKLVESCALRVRRNIFGAYALWTDGKFAWAGSPYRTYTMTEFRKMIGDELDATPTAVRGPASDLAAPD